jgi:hypothetical protein
LNVNLKNSQKAECGWSKIYSQIRYRRKEDGINVVSNMIERGIREKNEITNRVNY